MIKVGIFEAKMHLSSLLHRVNRGEEVLITKRGKAVDRLVPAEQVEQIDWSKISTTINELLALRKEVTLGSANWKTLRDEGRR